MVLGAVALASFVTVASALLASWGLREVAGAAARDAGQHAVATAKKDAHDAAVQSAARLDGLAARVHGLADRIADATQGALEEKDETPAAPAVQLLPLGESGLAWRPPDTQGAYVVAQDAAPSAEVVARLMRISRRLDPFLRAAVDGDEGVVHAAAWIDGVGLVAVAPVSDARPGVARLTPGFGPEVLCGDTPSGGRWLRTAERMAAGRVASYVVPLYSDPPQPRLLALVSVDLSCAAIQTALGAEASPDDVAAAVVSGDGELLATTPDLAERLHVPERSSEDALSALRAALGGTPMLDAPEGGLDVRSPRALATVAGAPRAGWSVVAVMPPAAEIAVSASGAAAVEAVARRQTISFIALSVVFGGMVALGAYALAEALRRRLRPVLVGAAAHARGELDYAIACEGEDELAELSLSLNATATRLRQNLGRLQESERRLSGLIESMGEGFIIADSEERITFVNPRFAELVRRQPSAIVGRYVEELLVPESLERYRSETARRVEGRASQYEATWQVFGGRCPRTIVSGMPMYDADGVANGSFSVVTDVTDRTVAQEELARTEKLRALGEMAGGVAHDFNNLLTVVLGNAQFLLLEELPDEVARTLRAIEKSALDGTERVRRITEFTKVRSVDANAPDVDMNDVVETAVTLARRRHAENARDRGVQFVVETRRGSRRVVRGDGDEMREALTNLLDNAFEAMPKGGRLTVETFDRGEDAVGVRIEDTGCGMDADVRHKAFDPFFTTKDVGRCSGLGLSISYGIVRAHGGRIDLKSVPGKGATFTIVLPAHAPRHAAADSAPIPAPAKPRVLLVGLDLRESESVQRGLRELGVYVATVGSPQAALAILKDGAIFNTLVVEHDLGLTSGWSTARDARVLREDLRIVLLTTPGRPIDETQSRNAGIDRVLVRPFDARDLHAAVFSLLATPRHAPKPAADAPAQKGRREENAETREIWGGGEAAPLSAGGPPPSESND